MSETKETILITGCTGQDGQILLDLLSKTDCKVIGTTRSHIKSVKLNEKYKNNPNVNILKLALTSYPEIKKVLDNYKPSFIFNLAAQSSVGKSFTDPLETEISILDTTYNLLQALRGIKNCKFFNFLSSECFGECDKEGANEQTEFKPVSPYANAKVSSALMLEMFCRKYGLNAINLFLFNHESEFRSNTFVTAKIIKTAIKIVQKKENVIVLGNCDIIRDWIWAEELLEFIVKNRHCNWPQRLVLGGGTGVTLRDFAGVIFDYMNLNLNDHLINSEDFVRVNDINHSLANPTIAKNTLGWSPQITGKLVARELIHRHYDKVNKL